MNEKRFSEKDGELLIFPFSLFLLLQIVVVVGASCRSSLPQNNNIYGAEAKKRMQ